MELRELLQVHKIPMRIDYGWYLDFVIDLNLGHRHIMIRTIKLLAKRCALLEASVLMTMNKRTLQ